MADAAELMARGKALQDEGKLEEAVEAYKEALEADPGSGEAWFQKAFCLHELKRYDESSEAVAKALEINPGDLNAMKLKFSLAGKTRS